MTAFATYVLTLGQGPRQALAIHCNLAHAGAWGRLSRLLGDRLTFTAYDLPGHGRSGTPEPGQSMHDLATGMGTRLLSERMDLIGHSFGATVALRLAIEHPELVRSLTLIEPVFFAALAEEDRHLLDDHAAELAMYTQGLVEGDMDKAARGFNRVWGDGSKWADIPEPIRDYMIARMPLIPGTEGVLFDDDLGLLAPGRLERAAMPVLLIEGAKSPAIVAAIGRALEARLPDARRVVVPDAGHMVPITHPEPVAAAIGELLEETQE